VSSTRRASGEALLAALLFGAAAPAGKLLVGEVPPVLLAGLLYLGAAAGIAPRVWLEARRSRLAGSTRAGGTTAVRSDPASRWRLAGAIVAGGIVAPVLLLAALREADASAVSLLLNLELAATALLGVALFGEHAGARAWAGILGAVVAGLFLSAGGGAPGLAAGALAVGACLCWGLDNQWTALVDGLSPARSTLWKGLVAGGANVALGVGIALAGGQGGVGLPGTREVLAALGVGALSYGASIALHVSAAQALGATRAQAIFAASPFFGAGLAVFALGEPFGIVHVGASALFAVSVALVIADRHAHAHSHGATSHVHSHQHDDGHHDHVHPGQPASLRHSHWHDHDPVTHAHPHASDLHHRHDHA
jgi:drug/metabolite transporter (DMT)-like permease